MATLFNTKISNTYQGLLKTVDNAAISATLRELSDGSGNQTGLYLNTAGDFKVTSVLEWGSLKDTGTGVTITRYVTSTDGLENFDNNTSLPTSAAVKLYVDTKFATSDTLQEVLSFGNTTSGNDIVVSLNDDITFTDSSKALFGNGQDLEINHNGTDSFVTDLGTGDLRLRSDNSIKIQASTGGNNLATFTKGAGVDLYFNNAKKLETTNTGISVTGIISNLTNPIAAQDAATKSYVDALDAGSDLDITDGTNTGAVNLNTQTLSILGTTNEIEAVVSGQGVTIGLPSSISTDLVGNVTGNLTGNVAGDLTGNVTSTSVLANGVTATTQASTDSSTKVATTAYVKGLDNASDLDFSGDSGTGDVNLNAQTFAITGTANQIESSASNQGLSLQFPTAGVTLPNGSVATTQSAEDNSTKVATTSYVDTSAALYLPLVGGTMSGNTIHNDSIKSIYGTGSDAQVYHDGSNFYANNSTGQLNIDQSAVTESIVFKTSDANALDTTALIINRGGDLITGRDVTIAGDLTVNGTTTTVNSQTLSVDDPLISLAINNAANSLDIGYYGKYNDGTTRYLGLFNDSSDSNKFKLFKGTTVEPTTTVNIGAAGYAAADLELANLVATGNITVGDAHTIGNDGNDNLLIQSSTGENVIIRSANIINLRTNGNNNALILDASQNATFAGNIVFGDSHFIGDDSDNNLLIQSSANENVIINSSDDLFFRTSGTTQLQITSTNATFAGGLTVQGATLNLPNSSYQITGGSALGDLRFVAPRYRFYEDTISGTPVFSLDGGNAAFSGGITSTFANISGAINAGYFRTAAANTDYNLITRDSTGNTLFVQNVQSNANQPIANFRYGSGAVNAGTPVLQVSKDNSHFVNCNVGIGTASPDRELDVSSNNTPTIRITNTLQSSSNYTIGAFEFYSEDASTPGGARVLSSILCDNNQGSAVPNGELVFSTALGGGSGAVATERMRITSAGNVGIGTDSPTNGKLVIDSTGYQASLETGTAGDGRLNIGHFSNGTFIGTYGDDGGAADLIRFGTHSGDERMRITSGGNVLIGTTTAITTSSTYSNITLDGSMTVGPNLGAITADAAINIKEFGGTSISFFYGTTKVGSVTNTSSATSYNTSSDYRLKEDLKDFNGLDKVSKIPVYDFKWKTDESRSYGVMAHELQEVLPDAVSGEKDAEEMQGVDYSKIVPLLIKSIQEQQVMLKQLKAEIDILKAK